jgi:predicted metalloprotease with PDZ domain
VRADARSGSLRAARVSLLAAGLVASALVPGGRVAAQVPRDTLAYDIATTLQPAHFSVEARFTISEPGTVELSAPPSAHPAGTRVTGFTATDDRGVPLRVRRAGDGFLVEARPGAVRFRYQLDFQNAVAMSSTGAGLDSTHLYAVGRSVFVGPDPTGYRKTSRPYPVVQVHIGAPPGWHLVTSWGVDQDLFAPADGQALLGATLAAAPDFRVYHDTAGGAAFVLAIRGRRHFSDSALMSVIAASLTRAAAALGAVPVPRVTYTSDTGWKGRTSGSLQGLSSVGLIWEPGELLERARSQDLFHETLHLWFGGAMETERWWTEGVTDYYAARLYAEWTHRPEELADLCFQSLDNYLRITHNTAVTMELEGRSGYVGDNTALLVYRKGMLAGLLLDAAIRRGTDGEASLDDVARRMLALAHERRTHAVRGTEIQELAIDVGGSEVERAWNRVVAGTRLISEDEVRDALRVVTGGTVAAPAPRAKEQKVLSHPNP